MAKVFKKKLKDKRVFILFLLVVFFGAVVRFVLVNRFGLNSQEALLGYRAFSLAQTGKDETGRNLPLIFTSFSDFQLPLPTYLTLPAVKLFGLSKIVVRLPFLISGVLAIVSIFFITKELFPEKKSAAFWAGIFAALSPGLIFFSQVAFAEGMSLAFFLAGFVFLLKKYQRKKSFFWGAIIFFLFSLYSSKSAWFFLFPFLVFWLIYNKFAVTSLKVFIIVTIFFLPFLFIFFRLPSAKQSFLENDLTFFSDMGIRNAINMMRGEEIRYGLPFLGRLFYNKSFWLIKFLENFLRHFTPRFFFAAGDQNLLHGFSNFGPVPLVGLLPALLGLVDLMRNKDERLKILFSWFTFAVFPSVLMIKSPDQLKFLFSLPVVIILIGLGISKWKNQKVFLLFLVILTFNFLFVFFDIYAKEKIRSEKEFGYGFSNLALWMEENNWQKFEKIYITDRYVSDPLPLLLFYFRYPPGHFICQIQVKSEPNFREWLNKLDNIQVGRPNEFQVNPGEKALFVITPEEEKSFLYRFVLLDKIGRPTNEKCYKLERIIRGLAGKSLLQIASSIDDNCFLIEDKAAKND